MEITSDDAPNLSRTEMRKQKLAEYLLTKGRLNPPNPKPYLKNSTVLTKPPGAAPKSHAFIKGKENSVPSAAAAKKDVPKGNALAENKKNSRTLPKAPSAVLPHAPLKSTVSQTTSFQAGTHCKDTARAVRNVSNVKAHKQDKAVRKAPASASSQAQPPHRSTMNAATRVVKTGLQKTRPVTMSEKVAQKSQVKCTTVKEQRSRDGKSFINKQATVSLNQTKITTNLNKPHTDLKKTLNRCPLAKADRSGKTQAASQDTRLSNKLGNKPGFIHTQGGDAAPSRQISSRLTTENLQKSTGATVAGVKKAASHQQQRRTMFNLPSKPAVQVPVPQTLPRPSKTSRLTDGPKVQPKTPKSTFNPGTNGVRTVPLDGRSKPTAAQEERLRKLKEWREAKGITYKRPPMPVQTARRKTTALPPQGYWSTIEQEDEVHGFVCAVDQSLNDCIKLLQQGCPADQVQDVLSRVPMAQKFVKYWICQVRLMEREGNLDVLPTFEEAVRVVREPVDELRSVVFDILKKKEAKGSSSERENDVGSDEGRAHGRLNICTPKPVGALIRGEKRDSSVIKYKITATPGGKRSQQRQKPGCVNGHEIRFLTPVRRSLRIEKTAARYPTLLQEHDPCVSSVHELLAEAEGQSEFAHPAPTPTSPLYVYRENEALKEHVQIHLVYDETDASPSD